ncbi:MAG: hypothetical protein DI537_23910 [Stutzerimonas stutzeri]|nr:MAG: hypothetical protein DI537_23910 [Stutzerimonas stutzeri]
MAMDDFHNRLRIMRGIDAHEFEAAGLTLDQWRRFDRDPFDFFIRADDPTAEAVWSIVEARAGKRAS